MPPYQVNRTIFFVLLLLLITTVWSQTAEKTVAAFVGLDGAGLTKVETQALNGTFQSSLNRLGCFRLIEREQIQKILAEQAFHQTGAVEQKNAIEAGNLLGARNIIMGSIGKTRRHYILNLRLVDVKTGEILIERADKAKGSIDDVLDMAVPVVSARLCGYTDDEISKFMRREDLQDIFVKGISTGQKVRVVTFFTLGVGGTVLGALFKSQADSQYDTYTGSLDATQVKQARKDVTRLDGLSVAGFAVGLAGLLGGGLSFAF